MKKYNFLEKIYIALVVVLLLLAGFTPLYVHDGFYFLTEEVAEVILIFLLFSFGILIIFLFKKENEKQRRLAESTAENLNDAFKYLGKINIYTKELHSIVGGPKRFPETAKDFRQTLRLMAEKVLSVVEADYVLLKIIDQSDANILGEIFVARGDRDIKPPAISNRTLISNEPVKDLSFVSAEAENIAVKVFSVLPAINFSTEQIAMIKAILSQVQMIYLIFSSGQIKNLKR
jgi:hypothetical protein